MLSIRDHRFPTHPIALFENIMSVFRGNICTHRLPLSEAVSVDDSVATRHIGSVRLSVSYKRASVEVDYDNAVMFSRLTERRYNNYTYVKCFASMSERHTRDGSLSREKPLKEFSC